MLSERYKSEEVFAQSTDWTRTKQTTKLVLAGVAGVSQPPSNDLNKYLGFTGPNRISGEQFEPLLGLSDCSRYGFRIVLKIF